MLRLFLITKGNFTPSQGVLLSLAFLLAASSGPSAAVPSCPLCQIVPLLSTYSLNFPFTVKDDSNINDVQVQLLL